MWLGAIISMVLMMALILWGPFVAGLMLIAVVAVVLLLCGMIELWFWLDDVRSGYNKGYNE